MGIPERDFNGAEVALHKGKIAKVAFISSDKILNVFEKPCYALLRSSYDNAADDVIDYFKDTYSGQFRPYNYIVYLCSLCICGI